MSCSQYTGHLQEMAVHRRIREKYRRSDHENGVIHRMPEQELALIKGGKGGLSLVIDEKADISTIVRVLRQRLASSPAFFRGAVLRLQTSARALSETDLDLLATTVGEFGMTLSDEIAGEDASTPVHTAGENTAQATDATVADIADGGGRRAMFDDEGGRALLVKRTLRSGQSVTFDGNVIIRGDVNPGAMITSTGDIIVLGTLRGVAHAGAAGDDTAVVMAFSLEAPQLRIAGAISRAPDEKAPRPSGPEIARVKDNVIQIEAYQP